MHTVNPGLIVVMQILGASLCLKTSLGRRLVELFLTDAIVLAPSLPLLQRNAIPSLQTRNCTIQMTSLAKPSTSASTAMARTGSKPRGHIFVLFAENFSE